MSDDIAPVNGGEVGAVLSFTAGGASTGALIAGPAAPIGAIIGAIVGAAVGVGVSIASRYLKKDPYEDYQAPEPDRRKNKTADEGNPCPVGYGHLVRFPGQVIWMSAIIPDEISQTVPAKGKSTQVIVVDHRYVCDIAIAWCRNFTIDVKRIYANGEVIHDSSLDLANEINVTSVRAYVVLTGSTVNQKELEYIEFKIPISAFDPTAKPWVTNDYYTISRGAGGIVANEGRLQLTKFVTEGSHKLATFIKCIATVLADGTTTGCPQGGGGSHGAATYTFTRDNVSENRQYMDGVAHHHGERFPQGLDPEVGYFPPVLDQELGGIAYTGTTYSEIRRLNVTKWGSTIPRFEALIEIHDGPELASKVLERIIARGDSLKGTEINVSAVTGDVRGYVMMGPTTTLSAVQEFMSFYLLEAHEGFGFSGDDVFLPQLIFQPRDAGLIFFPRDVDVGAHAFGSEGIRDELITVEDGRQLPNHMVLSYIDAEKSMQVGSVEYINVSAGNVTPRTTRMQTDFVLTSGEARQHAKTFLQLAQQNVDGFKATLPPSWIALRPGDRLDWPALQLADRPRVRLAQVTRGQDSVLEIEGTIDDALIYTQTPDTWLPPASPNIPGPSGPLTFVYDIAPLHIDDAKRLGLYIGAAVLPSEPDQADVDYRDRQDVPSTSATLWRSADDGANYTILGALEGVGLSGVLFDNKLGDGVDYVWDTTNVVTVTLNYRTMGLESATREEVSSGRRNVCLIGAEVVGFCTVVSLGDDVYELSDLLRGLRDTSHLMATHSDNESFVSIIDDHLKFVSLPLAEYKRKQVLKAIPAYFSIEDEATFLPEYSEPQAETLKPFTVRSRWLRRYPDQSIRVYFKRRTRVPFRVLSGLITPNCETQNCFKMDVFWFNPENDFAREFVRTLCCCFECEDGEHFIDYTAAEQAVDFFDTGRITNGLYPDNLELELYQCSDTVGEGRRNIICVTRRGSYVQYDMCPPGG